MDSTAGTTGPLLYCEVVFPLPLSQSFSYCWLPRADSPPPQLGCRVYAPLGPQARKLGWVIASSFQPPPFAGKVKPLLQVLDQQPLFDQKLLALAHWLADFNFCSLGEALEVMLPGKAQRLRLLEDLVEIPPQHAPLVQLSSQQKQVLTQWQAGPERSYLFGVTGSGKTEVFLHAAEQILRQGHGVIYLVPEISLAYQLYRQLKDRFGEQLALLHSQLTPTQRLTQWRQIQQQPATLVLGVRSAIFAPLAQLGLVIIDEEHESSYKSSNRPRYHARQVAMHRCHQQQARLLMGSATPSLEAWQGMKSGTLQALELPHRIAGFAPSIELVDLNPHRGAILAPVTMLALEKCHQQGHQAILFINQRGFARTWHCFHCRQSLHCQQCSVSLTVYQQRKICLCHHCGYHCPLPRSCPSCGGTDIDYLGVGTEQLQQHLQQWFPQLRLACMDSNSTSKRGSSAEILARLGRGEIDFLLGTHMVVKGLHFPNVQLMVIVQAESALNLPDFRASERGFAQMLQAAGRSGRFHPEGRVLLQTYQPQLPIIQAVVQGQLPDFYQRELAQRKSFAFPPFSRLFRLLFIATQVQKLVQEMERWAQLLQGGPWTMLGPTECALAKIAGKHRGHILLSSSQFNQAHTLLTQLWRQQPARSPVRVEIDCDPQEML